MTSSNDHLSGGSRGGAVGAIAPPMTGTKEIFFRAENFVIARKVTMLMPAVVFIYCFSPITVTQLSIYDPPNSKSKVNSVL